MKYDQEMIRVTVDITGMYFGIQVKVPKEATIEEVMKIAVKDTANGFPRLTFAGDGRGFLNSISVEHKNGSAVSRQDNTRVRPDGIYSFKDQSGDQQPLLVWQYYVSDRNGTLKSGQDGGSRRIVPFSVQNHLADQDVIVWRLVGISTAPTGTPSAEAHASGAKARISAK